MAVICYKDALDGEKYIGERIHYDNDWICLTKRDMGWQIYNVTNGKPFLRVWFTRKEDALEFGKLAHQWYGEHMWIWEVKGWEGIDLTTLYQHTIPQGVRIREAIDRLREIRQIDNLEQFKRMVSSAAD